MSDEELITKLKRISETWGFPPEGILDLGGAGLKEMKRCGRLDSLHYESRQIDEYKLPPETFSGMPHWAFHILPPGASLELHTFEDGRKIGRILRRPGWVLYAVEWSLEDSP